MAVIRNDSQLIHVLPYSVTLSEAPNQGNHVEVIFGKTQIHVSDSYGGASGIYAIPEAD